MIVVQVFSSSLGNRCLCAITVWEAALLAVECPGMSNTQRKRTVTKPTSPVAPSLPWGLPSGRERKEGEKEGGDGGDSICYSTYLCILLLV